MRYIQGEDRTQGTLFPVSLDELIPEDHLVRVIEAYISLLDLEQLGFDKPLRKQPDGLRTTPATCSNSISTAISNRCVPQGGWRLSASATSKSCGCWGDWLRTLKPSLIFAETTVQRLSRHAARLSGSVGLPA